MRAEPEGTEKTEETEEAEETEDAEDTKGRERAESKPNQEMRNTGHVELFSPTCNAGKSPALAPRTAN